MAHEAQERYSALILAKIRKENKLKNSVVFNTDYEGSPKAGNVKIPVRDTEVAVSDYDKANGITAGMGSTTYENFPINKDKAVNEIIDGYDAQLVPDNLVADRLDSAGYSLATALDNDGATVLLAGSTPMNVAALAADTVYDTIVDIREAMSEANIPDDGRRYLLVTPRTYSYILKSPEFIKASALGDDVVQSGVVGKIAGFTARYTREYSSASIREKIYSHIDSKNQKIQMCGVLIYVSSTDSDSMVCLLTPYFSVSFSSVGRSAPSG